MINFAITIMMEKDWLTDWLMTDANTNNKGCLIKSFKTRPSMSTTVPYVYKNLDYFMLETYIQI